MRAPFSLLLPVFGLLVFMTGCDTFARRAEKKSAVFSALPAADQARLEKKEIHVGDTLDMVYIALGQPDEKKQSTTADGQTTTWIYNRYWQEYQGQVYDGYVRRVVTNPKTGSATVYYEPVSRPVYADRQQPVMRIRFADGKVTVIEQAKP